MALDVDDHDMSGDHNHGYSERLRIAKITDNIHSLASLVSAPCGVRSGWKIFDLEPVIRFPSFDPALIGVFCSGT
jgi:hypothetical protein